ncbi:winged helix-turn-helix transcriptional regulator [Candidatus Thorarchaeota archaeon]|nr:MAG: winged helix-turn-helix transcriptional regulator [Candidatus Thorarchaeota archaeon]
MTGIRPLDQKDIDILGALDKSGGKTSTEELSQTTNIPARTVRYRLQKMRDAQVLNPARAFTHERKMGLGETLLVIHTTPGSDPILEKMFEEIGSIYFWSSTYGRYNGFIIYVLYSLTTPSVPRRLAETFQREGLISDFYSFDVTDYEHKNGDFTYLDPKLGWQYDWKEWHKKIEKNLKSKTKRINTKCEENPSILEFDTNDYGLLRSFFDDAMVPQKDLAKQFALSETQVTKKIRRLENAGVIKGYGSSFKAGDVMVEFNLFLEIEEPVARIMNNFYTHPYLGSVIMESRTRWGIRMGLPACDINGFLQGLDMMKPYLKSCVFQVVHQFTRGEKTHPYDLFNKDTHKWETPLSNYLKIISDILAELR